jgi:glucokinase
MRAVRGAGGAGAGVGNEEGAAIVFDVGGTWFRSGVLTADGRLSHASRRPAINYRNTPHGSAWELQSALVDYLVAEYRRLRDELPPGDLPVGVSVGACVDARTGLVLDSGPLWGPDCAPFDLLGTLREREPEAGWAVVNDITAALLAHVAEEGAEGLARQTLFTVSTGVGCRTYDAASRRVPVDPIYGVQGEIGHVPIDFRYDGRRIELRCDCGGPNHLNAFCSGRGVSALLPILAEEHTLRFACSALFRLTDGVPGKLDFGYFVAAVREDDGFALSVLDAVTLPMARGVLHLLVFDPEVERVTLTGGVVRSLGRRYVDSLLGHLEGMGLYQVTDREPGYFRRLVRLTPLSDDAGLVGAAIAARQEAGRA